MSWQNLRADIVEEFEAVAAPPPPKLRVEVPLAKRAFLLLSINARRRQIDRELRKFRASRPRWTFETCTVIPVRVCEKCGGHYEAREGCNWATAMHKPPCRG